MRALAVGSVFSCPRCLLLLLLLLLLKDLFLTRLAQVEKNGIVRDWAPLLPSFLLVFGWGGFHISCVGVGLGEVYLLSLFLASRLVLYLHGTSHEVLQDLDGD
jgi:hypothetical protein